MASGADTREGMSVCTQRGLEYMTKPRGKDSVMKTDMRITLVVAIGLVMIILLIALVPFNRDTSLTYWITAISYSAVGYVLWRK